MTDGMYNAYTCLKPGELFLQSIFFTSDSQDSLYCFLQTFSLIAYFYKAFSLKRQSLTKDISHKAVCFMGNMNNFSLLEHCSLFPKALSHRTFWHGILSGHSLTGHSFTWHYIRALSHRILLLDIINRHSLSQNTLPHGIITEHSLPQDIVT